MNNIKKEILNYPKIFDKYSYWNNFIENKVAFWMENSVLHTKSHCSRVLLFCLMLSENYGLSIDDENALAMAACFHDSRRQDDWLDVGHGQRAADYYKEYCQKNNLKYDERTYFIMAYHDRDDEYGIENLNKTFSNDQNSVFLYKIFKDSDALDRFRLAENALDPKYLRCEHSKTMIDFSKKILKIWNEDTSK